MPVSTVPPELIKAYRQSAPDKMESLDRLWRQAVIDGWQGPSVAQLDALVHRIAGSGGSYGFPDLSAAAKHLELMIKDSDTAVNDSDALAAAFEALREALTDVAQATAGD